MLSLAQAQAIDEAYQDTIERFLSDNVDDELDGPWGDDYEPIKPKTPSVEDLRKHPVLYWLANKPGTIRGGTWADFTAEDEGGYVPIQVTVSKALSLFGEFDSILDDWWDFQEAYYGH